MLQVHQLEARYGDFQALFGIDFAIDAGQTAAIIGANGAGKSTFLKALAGQIAAAPGAVRLDGQPIGGLGAHRIVKLGIALVPEGRRLFPSLSVEENLRIGATPGRPGPWTLQRVYELFPALVEKRQAPGTSLSGGQQQMVAIGRALMSNPRLLLCDEISLGLAPTVIKDLYARLPSITAQGTAVVIVEQDIDMALRAATQVACFMHGRVSLQGAAHAVSKAQISAAYFGLGAVAEAADLEPTT
jgi:branched-chain amino acid transport system ATP-binding protein